LLLRAVKIGKARVDSGQIGRIKPFAEPNFETILKLDNARVEVTQEIGCTDRREHVGVSARSLRNNVAVHLTSNMYFL
jgi:hypothetical protein